MLKGTLRPTVTGFHVVLKSIKLNMLRCAIMIVQVFLSENSFRWSEVKHRRVQPADDTATGMSSDQPSFDKSDARNSRLSNAVKEVCFYGIVIAVPDSE